MLTQEQVMPLILEACPSFQQTWEASDDDDKELLYIVMGDLARHLLELYREGRTAEFRPLCEVIERFQAEGDDYVRGLAIIGFLEGVQNNWSHSDIDPETFTEFLPPKSRESWQQLNDFWAGMHKD